MLISGEDGARVAEARSTLLRALIGPEAEAEMRLDRIAGGELRREPSRLLDALKAVGFFPGVRAILLEEATDGLAPIVSSALDVWKPGDARLVVTGVGLPSRGALRKLFDSRPGVAAVVIYDDPLSEVEISEMLREAGLRQIEPAARDELLALAQTLAPGDFRGLVERLSLHEMNATGPLGATTVAALAPQAGEAAVDELLAALTNGRRDQVPPLLARLSAQGIGPVAVTIQALRHFRALLAVVSDPGGINSGLAALRPPAGGARRQMLTRGAESWRRERIEDALRGLVVLDLELRSGRGAPDRALIERVLMRLATARTD